MSKDPTGITGGPGMGDTDAVICAYLALAAPVMEKLAKEAVALERMLPDGNARARASLINTHIAYLAECGRVFVEALMVLDATEAK